jgi:hypothetical protein
MENNIRLGVLMTFLIFFSTPMIQAQIEIGGEEEKEGKPLIEKAGKKSTKELDNSTKIYFNWNPSSSFRSLEKNGDLFGDTLGNRIDEKRNGFSSFGIGFKTDVNKHIQLMAGIGFMKNGEQYSYEQADSNFMYVSTYKYISLPVSLNYYTGSDIQFMVGLGLLPGMFVQYTQEQTWKTTKNVPGKNDIKVRSAAQEFNQFVMSAFIQTGVQLKYAERWSIYIVPEYRIQLMSTYSKQEGFIHKANAIGANIGFTYQL